MIAQLDSENADRNLTAIVLCLTHTPDADNPRLCQAIVFLGDGTKNLDGTGGNFSLRVDIGGQTGPVKTIALAAGVVRGWLMSDPFLVPANAAVTVRVLSPNAADVDVDVTASLMDVGISQASNVAGVDSPVVLANPTVADTVEIRTITGT